MQTQVEEKVRQAEAVLRFAQEVHRRLAELGFAGIDDLLCRYAQLERALSAVALGDLQGAAEEAARLHERLRRMCTELEHLSTLKAALAMCH